MPFFAAGYGKAMWVVDALSPALIKTDLDGAFLDWGEKPFGNQDIAWDGKNLWALDSKNKRICIIEKTKSGKHLGMCSNINQGLGLIISPGNDFIFNNNNSTDRNFISIPCFPGLL